MRRMTVLIALLALAASGRAATFSDAPILKDAGIDTLTREVVRDEMDRELFGTPYATVVVGHVDVYEGFPYLESRWFQVVSDPEWNRLLAGEVGGSVAAFDGAPTDFGPMQSPRGLATDEYDRIWVADTGNHRVLVFQARSEYGRIDLEPLFSIDNLSRPYDVAYSDGGTPFAPGDDRVYVADSGKNRVVAFDVRNGGAREAFSVGGLGRGVGSFAGPLAVTVGRSDGAATATVYVADAHNARIVSLADRGDHFDWIGEAPHTGTITALDTDHWGSVYAASPAAGTVTKFAADLASLATLDGVDRPRAFHVPFVNRTDHRTGVTRRAGQGSGLVVEEWTERTGIRLVRLGVEVKNLQVHGQSDVTADFVLTDRAAVRADFVGPDGRVARSIDLGTREPGAQHVAFVAGDLGDLPDGEETLRITATSGYAEGDDGRAEASFSWSGSAIAPASVRLIASEPNPFRAHTSIRFSVPNSGSAFDLRVFDIAGRLVRVIDDGNVNAGVHTRTWDGGDQSGRPSQAGIYFLQLAVDDAVATKKVVLLR